ARLEWWAMYIATFARHALLFVFVLAVFAAGCRQGGGTTAGNAPAAGPNVWATINGRDISRDEVEKAYRREAAPDPLSDEETLAGKLEVLNQLIAQELLLDKARELKVEVTDTELDEAFNEAKQN